jgi:hypothetical protein
MENPSDRERVLAYLRLRRKEVKIKGYLGDGTDGAVWSTNYDTAVKVFKYEFGYCNERDCYQRLAE